MTLKEAIEILSAAGVPNAAHDARSIFRHLGRIPEYNLLSPNVTTDSPAVASAIKRRSMREPLQYIIGEVDFYNERYFVSADCLIPRSDTEILVDYAVKNLPRGARFLDLCTGSGCVAVSVLKNTEDTTAKAADVSREALDIARGNAERNGVDARLELISCDVKESKITGDFFAVLANPPYVTDSSYEKLAPEIYFEPKCAFVGGEDGCDFYRAITLAYKDSIPNDGFIAYEIGYDQSELICDIAKANGMHAEIINDFSGNPRVAVLRNPQK